MLVLGAAGFIAGFFGPMVLAPESNIGPIIGILYSGPAGVLLGLLLGGAVAVLRIAQPTARRALVAVSAALALATLYACLPEPALRGSVIDASVVRCQQPEEIFAEARARWEDAVGRTRSAAPPENWQTLAESNIVADAGVVLTVQVHRRLPIWRHRRPWDRGETTAGVWQDDTRSERYYVSDAGDGCDAYRARPRMRYWPVSDAGGDPQTPAEVWPPLDTQGFLSLQRLGPVPAEYADWLD
jgi:hypothetical protein